MSATNNFESLVLAHLFANSNIPSIGDATGLRGASAAGSFWITLHTASPGETGVQTTNETAYTNYVRVSVARSTAQWTTTAGLTENVNAITFATGGVTGASITHFGIGSDSSQGGNLWLYGALTATLAVSNGITPSFAAADMDITLD